MGDRPIIALLVVKPRKPAVDPPTSHGRDKYLYDCVVDGECLVRSSHDPEHELARALLERGIKGRVQMVEAGTDPPKLRLGFDIEDFAPWSLTDHWRDGLRLKRYEPFPQDRVRPGNGSRSRRVDVSSVLEPSEAPECHPTSELML